MAPAKRASAISREEKAALKTQEGGARGKEERKGKRANTQQHSDQSFTAEDEQKRTPVKGGSEMEESHEDSQSGMDQVPNPAAKRNKRKPANAATATGVPAQTSGPGSATK